MGRWYRSTPLEGPLFQVWVRLGRENLAEEDREAINRIHEEVTEKVKGIRLKCHQEAMDDEEG